MKLCCLWKCNKADSFQREKGVPRMDGCGDLPQPDKLAKSKSRGKWRKQNRNKSKSGNLHRHNLKGDNLTKSKSQEQKERQQILNNGTNNNKDKENSNIQYNATKCTIYRAQSFYWQNLCFVLDKFLLNLSQCLGREQMKNVLFTLQGVDKQFKLEADSVARVGLHLIYKAVKQSWQCKVGRWIT